MLHQFKPLMLHQFKPLMLHQLKPLMLHQSKPWMHYLLPLMLLSSSLRRRTRIGFNVRNKGKS